MRSSSNHFFRLFFSELERLDIPYVLLHSYERFPEFVASDVAVAVAGTLGARARADRTAFPRLVRSHGMFSRGMVPPAAFAMADTSPTVAGTKPFRLAGSSTGSFPCLQAHWPARGAAPGRARA